MTETYHSIIGLPSSGKTTFLAALWHLIDAGEVATKLKLDKLVGDHQYLNTIVEAWRRCEEVPRTSMAAETKVAIHIHETATGRRSVLAFPDLSGESFQRQVFSRTCRTSYVDGFAGAGGVLLFTTADRATDGLTIMDMAPALEGVEEEIAQTETREWAPDMMPEQVRLVELLQFLQQPPFQRRKRRLSLVVSAWDVIAAPKPTPIAWLRREMPLLHQFLESNADSFESRVYGVSAQGGSLRGEQRDRLLRMTPSERVHCHGPEGPSHDLTDPIVWLMAEP